MQEKELVVRQNASKMLESCYICGSRQNLSLVTGRCWTCIEQDRMAEQEEGE